MTQNSSHHFNEIIRFWPQSILDALRTIPLLVIESRCSQFIIACLTLPAFSRRLWVVHPTALWSQTNYPKIPFRDPAQLHCESPQHVCTHPRHLRKPVTVSMYREKRMVISWPERRSRTALMGVRGMHMTWWPITIVHDEFVTPRVAACELAAFNSARYMLCETHHQKNIIQPWDCSGHKWQSFDPARKYFSPHLHRVFVLSENF